MLNGVVNSSTRPVPGSPTQTCLGLRESTAIPPTPSKGTNPPRGPDGVPSNRVINGRVNTPNAEALTNRKPTTTTTNNPTATTRTRLSSTTPERTEPDSPKWHPFAHHQPPAAPARQTDSNILPIKPPPSQESTVASQANPTNKPGEPEQTPELTRFPSLPYRHTTNHQVWRIEANAHKACNSPLLFLILLETIPLTTPDVLVPWVQLPGSCLDTSSKVKLVNNWLLADPTATLVLPVHSSDTLSIPPTVHSTFHPGFFPDTKDTNKPLSSTFLVDVFSLSSSLSVHGRLTATAVTPFDSSHAPCSALTNLQAPAVAVTLVSSATPFGPTHP